LAKINQELIDRLAHKLSIGVGAVYLRIQKIVKETGLERDLAALVQARRNDININKFSTLAQRNDIRGGCGEMCCSVVRTTFGTSAMTICTLSIRA